MQPAQHGKDQNGSRLSNKVELALHLEALTRCGGNCEGCTLTAIERRSGELWSDEYFARVGRFVHRYIAEQYQLHDGAIDELSLVFGQGDYFSIGDDRIDPFIAWMQQAGHGRAVTTMTASAIGNHDRLRKSVDHFYDATQKYNQILGVSLVFDPKKVKIAHFEDTYGRNIAYISSAFGGIDLNLNIGYDTVQNIAPDSLHDFAARNNIRMVTINLTPTVTSIFSFYKHWDEIIDWIGAFCMGWQANRNYQIHTTPSLARAIEAAPDDFGDVTAVKHLISSVSQKLTRDVHINGEGEIGHVQVAIGDMQLNARTGITPTAHIDLADQPEPLLPQIDAACQALATTMVRKRLMDRACQGCRWAAVCPQIGVHSLEATMKARKLDFGEPGGCPVRIKGMLDRVGAFIESDRDLMADCYGNTPPRVQLGMVPKHYKDFDPLDYAESEIVF